MRTSELQEKIVAQLGITLDDYYADPSLAVAKGIFQNLTRCSTDEAVLGYLHAQKPFCTLESSKAYWEKQITELEAKRQEALQQVSQVTEELAGLNKQEVAAREEWWAMSRKQNEILTRRNQLDAEIKALTAPENKRPLAKQIAALQKELDACILAYDELNEQNNQLYHAFKGFSGKIKDAKTRLKEIKNTPNNFYNDIYTAKDNLGRVGLKDAAYYKKDTDALDFLFAVLLGVRLQSKEDLTTDITPTEALTPAEKIVLVAKYMKLRSPLPKDWRQQLHRVCSYPLKRHTGTISNPTGEGSSFFELKKRSLSATDFSAFLALKIAALQHEYVLTGTGAIVLVLTGGLAATVSIREKGKIIAKQQKNTVETYVNLLQAKNQYAYHLMYHYDGGPAEGVGIETPGAYYILSEAYVFEITFMAAPMLLGFDVMSKTAQNISIVARLDDEQSKAEDMAWQQSDWEEEED